MKYIYKAWMDLDERMLDCGRRRRLNRSSLLRKTFFRWRFRIIVIFHLFSWRKAFFLVRVQWFIFLFVSIFEEQLVSNLLYNIINFFFCNHREKKFNYLRKKERERKKSNIKEEDCPGGTRVPRLKLSGWSKYSKIFRNLVKIV